MPKITILLLFLGIITSTTNAFPPAPHHVVQGLLRDEMGTPLAGPDIRVNFISESGVVLKSMPHPSLGDSINYRLTVPMDSGTTPLLYSHYAQTSQVPYRIEVTVGEKTYLPIEMRGVATRLGEPGGITNLNLTLGEDSDGDGLPDAWERALMNLAGSLDDIHGGDDSDGDGLTNLEEYYSGTYAFDENDGLRLVFKEMSENQMTFEFLGVTGRTYTLMRSVDLVEWKEVSFDLVGEDGSFDGVHVPSTRMLQIKLPRSQQGNANYKLVVH